MSKAMSIGIIGGADGPTAVFVAGEFPWGIFLLAALCIGTVIWFKIKKK